MGTPMVWNGSPLCRNGSPAMGEACCCGGPCECIPWFDDDVYKEILGTFPPFTDEYDPFIENRDQNSAQNRYVDSPLFVKLLNGNDFLRQPNSWDSLRLNKTSGTNLVMQVSNGLYGRGEWSLHYYTWKLYPRIYVNCDLKCFGEGTHIIRSVSDEDLFEFEGPAWLVHTHISFVDDDHWPWPSSFEVNCFKVFKEGCGPEARPLPQTISTWDHIEAFFSGGIGFFPYPFEDDELPGSASGPWTNYLFEWAIPEIEIVDNPFP
jgi:hypothetical protein